MNKAMEIAIAQVAPAVIRAIRVQAIEECRKIVCDEIRINKYNKEMLLYKMQELWSK